MASPQSDNSTTTLPTLHDVLIIGAGETAEGTARALHEQGVRTMFVANRRRERAIELAQRFGGETVAFDALPDELARADIVVASTSSPHLILGAEELADLAEVFGTELVLIDAETTRRSLQKELRWSAAYHRLAQRL